MSGGGGANVILATVSDPAAVFRAIEVRIMDSIIIKVVVITLLVAVLMFVALGDRRIRRQRELEEREQREGRAGGNSD